MLYFFFPLLLIFFFTHKLVYFYIALITFIPTLLGATFGHLGESMKDAKFDGLKTVLFWISAGCGIIIVYSMIHPF